MAQHKRIKIRNAIKTTLVNANTGADDKVFPNRMFPVFNAQLPVILIYTEEEPAQPPLSPMDSITERNLSVVVDICAQANQQLDDALDDLAKQVEDAMFQDESLGNLVNRLYLTNTKFEFIAQGEKMIGSLKLVFTVNYHTGFPGE